MKSLGEFHIYKLEEELSNRRRKNPSYSLRSFSDSLGVHSSHMSAILKKKRGIPKNKLAQVCERLGLTPEERELFINSAQRSSYLKPLHHLFKDSVTLEEKQSFKIIAEWEHFALAKLLEIESSGRSLGWLAKRLGITLTRLKVVIENLSAAGIIEQDKGQLKVISDFLETTDNIPSLALRKAHQEALEMAEEKLQSVPLEKRDYTSLTFNFDPAQIAEVQEVIREAQDKILEISKKNKPTEVYHFQCALFPITKNIDNQGENHV